MPSSYPPSDERWDYRPSEDEVTEVIKLFNNNLDIPEDFVRTAPPEKVFSTSNRTSECYYRLFT